MDLSNLSTEERRKVELENLAKATFLTDKLIQPDDELNFYDELKKHFGNVKIIKLKINAQNDMLWGSMGMQQFTNEFFNSSNLKNSIVDLMPFDEYFELKQPIAIGGNLFNLIGDLCSILKEGGCYGKWF
ncbi:MAG: hypothetical protein IPN86_15440 [Saprospiraceae bacterium]|nr:hypothetical protein [Saprospiraceae bacterium]